MAIDYGMGKTNIDTETNIRYGVISMHDVLQAWADSSEPSYPCKECDASENGEFPDDAGECGMCEPSSWFIDDDEYSAETCFDGTEISIYKSPFYTRGEYCSPCAPGAVNLNNTGIDQDDIGYCFGHDWFEDGKAPYRVFCVKTDKEILP